MAARVDLHNQLANAIGSDDKVYYRAPESLIMSYPCIVYDLARIKDIPADNKTYKRITSYTVKLIDYNPDSPIFEKIMEIPFCKFDRSYQSDNLNHFVFEISI